MNPAPLKIRLYGDPCLVQESNPIQEVGPSERLLIQSMIETMDQHKGIGLAAPQVGINQRLFVADVGDGPIAVINPKFLKAEGKQTLEEGCLSIPGIAVEVTRPQTIVVQYIDEHNNEVQKEFYDLMARVFLHETDHLDGKLILDYADDQQRQQLIEQYEEFMKSQK